MSKNIIKAGIFTLSIVFLSACSSSMSFFDRSGNQSGSSQASSTAMAPIPTNNSLPPATDGTGLPQRIAVILPLEGPLSSQGKTVRDGFLTAYYNSLVKTHVTQNISFYDSNQYKDMPSLYQKAVAEGANFVVGPLTKDNVQQIQRQGSFSVPVLALNYTDGSLPSNFYEFGLSPSDETQQVADKARQDGHSRAVLITTQGEWGQRVSKSLTDRWRANGGSIEDVLFVAPNMDLSQAVATLMHSTVNTSKTRRAGDNDRAVLGQQHRHDIDVVFLLAPGKVAKQIVPLIRFYYVGTLPVYSTSVVAEGSSPQDIDLNGVMYCNIPAAASGSTSLSAVGQDAYLLSSNLSRMLSMPGLPINGATGALTLTPDHKIYRRLSWTTINAG